MVIISQKYDGNGRNPDGSLKKSRKILNTVLTVFFAAVILGVSFALYSGYKISDISLTDNYIKIKGMYGTDIPINDIKDVSLKEDIPKVIMKTNGSNVGSRLKGNVKLEEIGK